MKKYVLGFFAAIVLVGILGSGGFPPNMPVRNQYFNGTNWVNQQGGPNGESYTAELNPDAFQSNNLIIVSALTLTAGKANSNTPLTGASLTPYTTSSINAFKWARILTTTSVANYPWHVTFYGSPDGATYTPILRDYDPTSTFYLNTSPLDSLTFKGRGTTTGNGVWVPLRDKTGNPVTTKFIVAVCSNDTAAAANDVFTVEIAGRQH